MERLGSASCDLDSLPHYCRIHGLPESILPEAARDVVYRVALPRFVELCQGLGIPATLFAIGEDLKSPACAQQLQTAHAAGAEVGNHSQSHDYALTRRPVEEIRREVELGEASIAACVGARPVGFRAPGYTLNAALYGVLVERGYRYDSSAFPAAPYWTAKAAVMGAMRLFGKRSHAVLDTPRVLLAPRGPYRPQPSNPYARGGGAVVELPIATGTLTRFPFIGTYAATLPPAAARAAYRDARGPSLFNFELHGIDLLDESDGIPAALSRVQRDCKVPASLKIQRLKDALTWMKDDHRMVPLREAAELLGGSLDSARDERQVGW